MIKHILLTRFNVVTNYSVNRKPPTTEWLLERLRIFEKITFPTVESQTVQPDLWLIFVDTNSPIEFINQLQLLLSRKGNNYELCFCDFFNSKYLQGLIKNKINQNDNWLITSRVDNDDGINPNYIKTIQDNVTLQRCFLNIKSGLIFTDKKAYRKNDYSNAFISLIEPIHDFSTVFIVDHINAIDFSQVKQIELKDGWLQYVHGKNVSNQIRGLRVHSDLISKEIKSLIPTKFTHDTQISILSDNTIFLLIRYTKSIIRRFKFELKRSVMKFFILGNKIER